MRFHQSGLDAIFVSVVCIYKWSSDSNHAKRKTSRNIAHFSEPELIWGWPKESGKSVLWSNESTFQIALGNHGHCVLSTKCMFYPVSLFFLIQVTAKSLVFFTWTVFPCWDILRVTWRFLFSVFRFFLQTCPHGGRNSLSETHRDFYTCWSWFMWCDHDLCILIGWSVFWPLKAVLHYAWLSCKVPTAPHWRWSFIVAQEAIAFTLQKTCGLFQTHLSKWFERCHRSEYKKVLMLK